MRGKVADYYDWVGAFTVFVGPVLLLCVVFGLGPWSAVDGATYSLEEAVEVYNYASADIHGAYEGYEGVFNLDNGNGVFFGESIEIVLTSRVDYTICIEIELGLKLICDDYDVQNMIVTDSYTINLYSEEVTTTGLYAMCINMHYSAPNYYASFGIGDIATGDLQRVVERVHSTGNQDASGQCAIWAVTDGALEADLETYGASSYELTIGQSILDNADVPLRITAGPPPEPDSGSETVTSGLSWVVVIIVLAVVLTLALVIPLAYAYSRGQAARAPPAPPGPVQQPHAGLPMGGHPPPVWRPQGPPPPGQPPMGAAPPPMPVDNAVTGLAWQQFGIAGLSVVGRNVSSQGWHFHLRDPNGALYEAFLDHNGELRGFRRM